MSILNKIKKNTVVKDSIFEDKEPSFISTGCYALNILFSGKLNGGIQLGRISSIVAPPSLGKCSRGTEEVDIIISEEVYEKYFKNKVHYTVNYLIGDIYGLSVEYADLFIALGINDDVTESTVYDPEVDIYVDTPYGMTKINHCIKKPSQSWVNVVFAGLESPCQVSPNHIFFSTEGTIFAKDSIGKKVIFRDHPKEVIEITPGYQDEPLYDISINNTNAPEGYEEAYYLSNGSLNHNSFVGLKVAKNAQKLNMEVVYIDTEFAFDPHFAEKIGVDLDKMLVIQNNKIEDVLQVVASLPTDMTKEEKASILVIIDSWGGLVTSKTVADAIDGKDVSDMTIAKKKNSLARILNGIGTTSFVVNQTYECHTENMRVKTPNGLKSIKDFNTGDKVLTNEGVQSVSYTVSYENTPVYRITLSNNTVLESTEEHKYMVNGNWTTVGSIKYMDKLTTVGLIQNNYLTVSKIEYIGNKTVYDIETPCHNYILENGIISHNSMNMYDPLAIGGGKGLTFCASSIVMGTSKAKSKDGDEISGAVITATNKKGRLAIENSKLKYLIKFNGGIHPYYGILEDALEGEYVVKPNQGWYTRPCVADDKKWREKEIWEKSAEFWDVIIQTTDFSKYIEKKYSFKHNYIIADDVMTIDEEDV